MPKRRDSDKGRRRGEPDDMPSTVARSDEKARRTWQETHDSAVEQYGEGERAHRTAFASLKHTYEKRGDRWVPKKEKGASDPARGSRPPRHVPAKARPSGASTTTGTPRRSSSSAPGSSASPATAGCARSSWSRRSRDGRRAKRRGGDARRHDPPRRPATADARRDVVPLGVSAGCDAGCDDTSGATPRRTHSPSGACRGRRSRQDSVDGDGRRERGALAVLPPGNHVAAHVHSRRARSPAAS